MTEQEGAPIDSELLDELPRFYIRQHAIDFLRERFRLPKVAAFGQFF